MSAHGPVSPAIERVVVDAILAGRIPAGSRLGEQVLAEMFAVSRTTVREALIRLEARGIVRVIPRRGWFIVQPTRREIDDAFHARLAVEIGILRCAKAVPPALVAQLRAHVKREQSSITDDDVGARCTLACTFHVTLAESLGNALLADTMLYLTARTVPINVLYQDREAAAESIDEHSGLVDAIEAADFDRAGRLMVAHLAHLRAEVPVRTGQAGDTDLRIALLPRLP